MSSENALASFSGISLYCMRAGRQVMGKQLGQLPAERQQHEALDDAKSNEEDSMSRDGR